MADVSKGVSYGLVRDRARAMVNVQSNKTDDVATMMNSRIIFTFFLHEESVTIISTYCKNHILVMHYCRHSWLRSMAINHCILT